MMTAVGVALACGVFCWNPTLPHFFPPLDMYLDIKWPPKEERIKVMFCLFKHAPKCQSLNLSQCVMCYYIEEGKPYYVSKYPTPVWERLEHERKNNNNNSDD